MVSNRLKEVIYKKLYSELSHLEIIEYKNEIWFIDREDRRWYFIYNTNGTMWWKYGFFCNFFEFFSITERDKFGPILSSWVEEVLNCRVTTTSKIPHFRENQVEEVLNCRVDTTFSHHRFHFYWVEEVLNCRVDTTTGNLHPYKLSVEEVLNCRVEKTPFLDGGLGIKVDEVLNSNV